MSNANVAWAGLAVHIYASVPVCIASSCFPVVVVHTVRADFYLTPGEEQWQSHERTFELQSVWRGCFAMTRIRRQATPRFPVSPPRGSALNEYALQPHFQQL